MSSRRAIDDFVKLEGAFLAVDETARGLVCPACHGGSSGERTFSITRQELGLVFNCYRASCTDGRGFVPTSGALVQPRPRTAVDDGLRPYYGEYLSLEGKDRAYFAERFQLVRIPDYAIGVTGYDEYAFEVRDPLGRNRGYIVRHQPWKTRDGKPDPSVPRLFTLAPPVKTRLYMHQQGATQSWYMPDDYSHGRTVVVVEDHVSALKVAQAGLIGVANIGTFIDETKVREIAQQRPTEVVIAFDNDATAQALKMARRWGLAFPKVRVAILGGDIKDTDSADVLDALGL